MPLLRHIGRRLGKKFSRLRRILNTDETIPSSTRDGVSIEISTASSKITSSHSEERSSNDLVEAPIEPPVEDFESLGEFEYGSCPLAPGCIRVARLLPGPGHGKDKPSRLIQVGEQQLALRTNIYDFLRYARIYLSLELPFWIDTICSNQDDLSERNQQVRCMGEIFSGAITVISWLGTSLVVRKSLHMLDGIMRVRTEPERVKHLKALDALYTFHPLYMLDYWTRMWITPEVLLARKLEILAADVVVPWESLEAFSSPYKEFVKNLSSDCQSYIVSMSPDDYRWQPSRDEFYGNIYWGVEEVQSSQVNRLFGISTSTTIPEEDTRKGKKLNFTPQC